MSDAWKTRRRVPQTRDSLEPPGWYSRGYLPHFDGGEIPQTVTFCLLDSLPRALLEEWRIELSHLARNEAEVERRKLIEAYLDRGAGSAFMNDPAIAKEIQNALLFFDGVRYFLSAWVVMPNHVHALLTPTAGWKLGGILHSWKSYTANQCNKLLGRSGEFWQTETFDRYIRDGKHYRNAIKYIENNPVKAGLVRGAKEWPWSSARRRATDE